MLTILMAGWLDETFAGFDGALLGFYHNLAEVTNYKLTWFFRAISFLADHGYGMMILSFLMISVPWLPFLKKKYPNQCKAVFRCGVIAAFAIAFGALITNYTIKENVARIRPYNNGFIDWWVSLPIHFEDPEFSFPSGHTTCTMATMTSVFLCGKRKVSWTAFILVVLMGASRNYFMMHYPTDIIGGVLVGGLAATLSYLIWAKLVFAKIESKKVVSE